MADQDLTRIAEALDALNDRIAEMNYRICLLEGRPAVPPRPLRRYMPPAEPILPVGAVPAAAVATPHAGGQPQIISQIVPEVAGQSEQPIETYLPPAAPVVNPLVNEVVGEILRSAPAAAYATPEAEPVSPLTSTAAPKTEKRIAEFINKNTAVPPTDAARGGRPMPGQQIGISLEQALGKNWAAWLGGLIVVLGMLYFLKLVWDQSWFYISPTARIATSMTVGAIFFAFGEALHFRKMKVLSGTLHGVGLAIVMASFFAAHTAFSQQVMSREAALAGVFITGIAGVGLSLHIRQITLAIIALLGMYFAPWVLRGNEDSSLAFLTYIGVITATGCTVAIVKPTWHWVRWVTLIGTWVWTLSWVMESHGALARAHFELALIFPSAYLVLFILEMMAGAYRASRLPEGPVQKGEYARNAISLFVNTCIALLVIWVAFPPTRTDFLYRVPLLMAGLMFAVWALTPGRAIKTTAVILATNLITLAVPMYFSADTATFAWAILSLSLGLFSSVINSRIVHWWAFGLVGLVFVRLFSVDAANGIYRETAYHFLRKDISWWAIMALGASAYAFAMSHLLKISLKRLSPQPSTDLWTEDPLDALLMRSAAWTRFAAPAMFVGVGFYLINDGAEILMIMALLLGVFGYFTRDVVARFGASALLLGATVMTFSVEAQNLWFQKILGTVAGEPVRLWLALPIAIGVIAHLIAYFARLRPGQESSKYSLFNSTFGTLMFAMGAVGCFKDGANVMLLHAAIMTAAALIFRNQLLHYITTTLLFVCLTRIAIGTHAEPLRQQAIVFLILCHLLAIFVAARIRVGDRENSIWPAWMSAGLGTLGFLLIGIRLFDGFSEFTLVAVVVTLALHVMARLLPGLGYQIQASLLMVVLLLKWLVLDSLGTVLMNDPYISTPIVHLHTLNGVLIAALVMLTAAPSELTERSAGVIRFWIFVALSFVWLNVETLCSIDAIMNGSAAWIGSAMVVKNTAISVLWGLVGFGFVLWGMVKKCSGHRWFGLWVLGATVGKILIVDMANVETVLRIVSFIAVGILLLGVSFVYHRQSQKNGRNGNSLGDDFNGTNGSSGTNGTNPKPANLV